MPLERSIKAAVGTANKNARSKYAIVDAFGLRAKLEFVMVK